MSHASVSGRSLATAIAPSNIAFIKYWGARDLARAIPENPSLSMTLSACHSRCTVEHLPSGQAHEILWRGQQGFEVAPPSFADRVAAHLDRLRDWAGVGGSFRVATENSFPSAAGIASSASGFAALTLAVLRALGREVSVAEQSALARSSGSGSASRSVLGGYVMWPVEDAGAESAAGQILPAEHWDLRDVIALVEKSHKEVSSLDGHRRAHTSPYFEQRQKDLPGRFERLRQALEKRDFASFGEVLEEEAIDLHLIGMSSRPPIFYWKPATLAVLEAVRRLRAEGIEAASTMDAGANVHVICTAAAEPHVAARLAAVPGVLELIHDRVGSGPSYPAEHLL